MDDKKFIRVLAGVIGAGALATALLLVYTAYLSSHCSIITYICNEI